MITEQGDLDKTTAGPGGPQIFAANGWGDDIGSHTASVRSW